VARVQIPIPKAWLEGASKPCLKIFLCGDVPINAAASDVWSSRKLSMKLLPHAEANALRAKNLTTNEYYPLLLPEVIDIYFRSPEIWPGLSGQSGGTNVRRRRLNPNDFLNLQMPWPDQETQAAIRECLSRVSAIRAIQSETSVELDAMLPSILDKAFKGEF
jgi:hypothetical protein